MTPDQLLRAARLSGLRVVELPGWRTNVSNGAYAPKGVLCHHTGSFDALTDADNDLDYAKWLAFTGRPGDGIPPPLCNLSLSAECVVYMCSGGNANHAGAARASGPMPAASDGSALYVGIEAMNSGSQGWGAVGKDAKGNPVTQGEAYARLCAALCEVGEWPASHVRAHRETSVTGKWDPGLLDMDTHRADVARLIRNGITERDWLDMATEKEVRAIVRAEVKRGLDDVLDADMNQLEPKGAPDFRGVTLRELLKRIGRKVGAV